MENENLTKLTKGILQITASLPVPIKSWVSHLPDTYSYQCFYKICRYVGTSCRVIGTCNNIDDALDNLKYWRDWYKTNDIFLVRCYVEIIKMDY